MEQGFDFSQLKWIVIFVVAILYKFISAKPKVTLEEEPELPAEMEEMMRQLIVEEEPEKLSPQPPVIRGERAPKVVHEIAKEPLDDKVEDGVDYAAEFDLKKAVIMSEILNRKYDE